MSDESSGAHRMRIGIVGAGAWGTTLASLASRRGDARLWAREPEVVDSVTSSRENALFLPGFRVADEMTVTGDLEESLARVDVAVIAVPAQHLRATIASAWTWMPGSERDPRCRSSAAIRRRGGARTFRTG